MFTVVGAEFFTEEDQMAVKISMEIKNKLIVIKLICYQIIIVEYWQLRPVEIFPLKEGMNYYLSQSKVVYIYLFLIYYYVSVFNEGCLEQVGDTCIIIVSGTHGLDPTLLL